MYMKIWKGLGKNTTQMLAILYSGWRKRFFKKNFPFFLTAWRCNLYASLFPVSRRSIFPLTRVFMSFHFFHVEKRKIWNCCSGTVLYFFMWICERYETAAQVLYNVQYYYFMWRSERYETAAQVLYRTIFFMWRSEKYENCAQVLYYFFTWRSEKYETAAHVLYSTIFFMWGSEKYETAAQVLYYFFMWRSEKYETAAQVLYYFFMWRSEKYETAAQVPYCIAAKFLVPDWGIYWLWHRDVVSPTMSYTGLPAYVAWRAGIYADPKPESTIFPSQGLRIWLQEDI